MSDKKASRPETLSALWRSEPSLLIGPALVSLTLSGLWLLPAFKAFATARDIIPWGFQSAACYTAFAILLSFGFHGAMSVYVGDDHKLQPTPRHASLPPAATRSTAILLTGLVYATTPVRPVSASWTEFVCSCALYAIIWDTEFFWLHRWAHQYGWFYRSVHKLHHTIKDPNCFAAYYVTYASHWMLEQAPTIACCILFLPRDAFVFSLYLATLATYVDHSGFDVKDVRLFGGVTAGHVLTLLYSYVAPLGMVETRHHDYHHEKFNYNYSLYFTFWDKLMGTYHEGRCSPASAALKAS